MTFASALRSLNDTNAIKRPMWKGYIERVPLLQEDGSGEPTYQYVLHNAAGDTYNFVMDGDDDNDASHTNMPVLTVELLKDFVADDWLEGDKAAIARGGTDSSREY